MAGDAGCDIQLAVDFMPVQIVRVGHGEPQYFIVVTAGELALLAGFRETGPVPATVSSGALYRVSPGSGLSRMACSVRARNPVVIQPPPGGCRSSSSRNDRRSQVRKVNRPVREFYRIMTNIAMTPIFNDVFIVFAGKITIVLRRSVDVTRLALVCITQRYTAGVPVRRLRGIRLWRILLTLCESLCPRPAVAAYF